MLKKPKNNLYDIVVIGGGPAGIAAAIYGAREGIRVLLITKDIGGQVKRKAIEIENYPGFESISGHALIQKFENHLKKFRVKVLKDRVVKIKKTGRSFLIVTAAKKQKSALSIIIASGADPRPLEVPGEKELIGRGVSYCATCDGPLYKNKIVAVVGGGNAGFEAAIFLARLTKKVYILEYAPKVNADKSNQQMAKKTGKIQIITNAVLKEIKGQGFVDSLLYQDNITKKSKTLKIDGVFIEIGSIPATGFVKGLVDFNKRDEIKVDSKTGETKIPGLFAAGDITNGKYKQIVIAASQGAKAALSASRYLQNL